ncbi:MAG TPA: hypothetical protein VFS30_11010 [Dehalococcoidia bacterium]|nr:hypothetical protein [Dehalococcoidia bacterium]
MAKVSEIAAAARTKPIIICDFTPPRGGDLVLLDGANDLVAADFIAVAYNPGKLVRADSAAAAFAIKQRQGTDVIFNLSPRDMNRLALQVPPRRRAAPRPRKRPRPAGRPAD